MGSGGHQWVAGSAPAHAAHSYSSLLAQSPRCSATPPTRLLAAVRLRLCRVATAAAALAGGAAAAAVRVQDVLGHDLVPRGAQLVQQQDDDIKARQQRPPNVELLRQRQARVVALHSGGGERVGRGCRGGAGRSGGRRQQPPQQRGAEGQCSSAARSAPGCAPGCRWQTPRPACAAACGTAERQEGAVGGAPWWRKQRRPCCAGGKAARCRRHPARAHSHHHACLGHRRRLLLHRLVDAGPAGGMRAGVGKGEHVRRQRRALKAPNGAQTAAVALPSCSSSPARPAQTLAPHRSFSGMPSNSSMQHTPPSASTSAPASSPHPAPSCTAAAVRPTAEAARPEVTTARGASLATYRWNWLLPGQWRHAGYQGQ